MKAKRFRVSTPTEYEDKEGEKKTAWTNVGIGFEGKKGLNVILNALPVSGKLFITEWEEEKEEQKRFGK